MTEDNRPSIGVAVIVVKDQKILIGEDKEKGENIFGVPGGHWENKETLKECAVREVREESGIICKNPKLVSVYDFFRGDKNRNYLSIGMKAEYVSGEPRNLIEEGRLNWEWHTIEDALKLNLFSADRILIQRYLSGVIYE